MASHNPTDWHKPVFSDQPGSGAAPVHTRPVETTTYGVDRPESTSVARLPATWSDSMATAGSGPFAVSDFLSRSHPVEYASAADHFGSATSYPFAHSAFATSSGLVAGQDGAVAMSTRLLDGTPSHDESPAKVGLSGSDDQNQKKKNRRFRLTHTQTRFLLQEFTRQPHPDAAQRDRLSREIPGLSPRQVQVWFQNRRAKMKRVAQEERDRSLSIKAHITTTFEPTGPQLNPYRHSLQQTDLPSISTLPTASLASVNDYPVCRSYGTGSDRSHSYSDHGYTAGSFTGSISADIDRPVRSAVAEHGYDRSRVSPHYTNRSIGVCSTSGSTVAAVAAATVGVAGTVTPTPTVASYTLGGRPMSIPDHSHHHQTQSMMMGSVGAANGLVDPAVDMLPDSGRQGAEVSAYGLGISYGNGHAHTNGGATINSHANTSTVSTSRLFSSSPRFPSLSVIDQAGPEKQRQVAGYGGNVVGPTSHSGSLQTAFHSLHPGAIPSRGFPYNSPPSSGNHSHHGSSTFGLITPAPEPQALASTPLSMSGMGTPTPSLAIGSAGPVGLQIMPPDHSIDSGQTSPCDIPSSATGSTHPGLHPY